MKKKKKKKKKKTQPPKLDKTQLDVNLSWLEWFLSYVIHKPQLRNEIWEELKDSLLMMLLIAKFQLSSFYQ